MARVPISPAFDGLGSEASDDLLRVVSLLGPFCQDVATALGGQLDATNLKKQIITTTLTTAATLNGTFSGGRVRLRSKIGKPTEVRTTIAPAAPPSDWKGVSGYGPPVWTYSQDGFVIINYIAGLSVSTKYNITYILE